LKKLVIEVLFPIRPILPKLVIEVLFPIRPILPNSTVLSGHNLIAEGGWLYKRGTTVLWFPLPIKLNTTVYD
jgi:hypothetical protein